MLRLRHLQPGWLLCVLLFEGTIALGVLATLAEITSWWSILVLPVVVAVLVKAEDLATGARRRPPNSLTEPVAGSRHRQPATPAAPTRHRAGSTNPAAPSPATPTPATPTPATPTPATPTPATTWRAVGRVRGRASVPGRRLIPPPRTTP